MYWTTKDEGVYVCRISSFMFSTIYPFVVGVDNVFALEGLHRATSTARKHAYLGLFAMIK